MATTTSPSHPDAAYVEANRDVVRRVLDRLTATGLLDQSTPPDHGDATWSAEKLRDFLNMEIPNVTGAGPLDASFKRMRRSARDFARAAGPARAAFHDDPAYFAACLQAMQVTLGEEFSTLTDGFAPR